MSANHNWTTPDDSQSVDFHRPTFCLPRRPLAFAGGDDLSRLWLFLLAPKMTVIYPTDAACVDMAERWRQLREKGRAEGGN